MMDKLKEKLKDRYNILAISFVLIVGIIMLQLADLQIVNGEKNFQDSQHKLLNNWKIVAPRGNIIDRNGVPIAVSRQGFNIQIVKSKLDAASLNAMLLNLIKTFEKNNDSYMVSFNKLISYPVAFGTSIERKELKEEEKVVKLKKEIKNELYVKTKEVDALTSLNEIYNYLRKNVFKIDESYLDEDAYKIMSMRFEIRGYNEVNPVRVANDVSKNTVAELEEKRNDFPGVTVNIEPMRKYIDGQLLPHVLGYVANIGSDLKDRQDEGYDINDLIGKSGVERAAEGYLRGKNGMRTIEVDTLGQKTGEAESDPAIPGSDVQLTIDMRLQKIAAESLEKRINEIKKKENGTDDKSNFGDAYSGAVVAMDVNNGEILAMASYPSYNPDVFLAKPNDKDAQKIIQELLVPQDSLAAPLMNRAITGIYAPGSTFKPLIGVAGLEEGVINPNSIYSDPGYYHLDGVKLTCMEYRHGYPAHGSINFERALATSCNIFFHKLGVDTRIDNIAKWGRLFGLGEKTGIDVGAASESKGILASKEYKKTITKDPWVPYDTAQVSIGQLYNAFTPIQLVNYVSTIANGGKRFKPHLIKRVVKYDGSIVNETKTEYEQLPVKKETIDAVKKGMIAVANATDGTAVQIFSNLPYQVAGKTGTAETGDEKHSNNGVFICYYPANPDKTPEIAIAVVIQRGVFGKFTAPIARDILAEYILQRSENKDNSKIEPDVPTFVR